MPKWKSQSKVLIGEFAGFKAFSRDTAQNGSGNIVQMKKMALGSSVAGLKWAWGRAVPKPEFCIPTSIAIAR